MTQIRRQWTWKQTEPTKQSSVKTKYNSTNNTLKIKTKFKTNTQVGINDDEYNVENKWETKRRGQFTHSQNLTHANKEKVEAT